MSYGAVLSPLDISCLFLLKGLFHSKNDDQCVLSKSYWQLAVLKAFPSTLGEVTFDKPYDQPKAVPARNNVVVLCMCDIYAMVRAFDRT